MSSLTDRAIPTRDAQLQGIDKRIITTYSPMFNCGSLCTAARTLVNAAWPSANDPVAIPFRSSEPMLVTGFGWFNGSGAQSENLDVGIYTPAFARLVSSGSTARTGVALWQWVDVTDTAIPAGEHLLVAANNGVATNFTFHSIFASVQGLALLGCLDSATNAFPLPDPLTNMAAASVFTRIPLLAITTRVPF